MNSIKQEKAKKFALRIVKLCKQLKEQREYVLSDQILRSGTSIGANLMEAEHAQSRSDFLHKNSISLKEANETIYWLDLLFEGEYISQEIYSSFKSDCNELIKILISVVKSIKANL